MLRSARSRIAALFVCLAIGLPTAMFAQNRVTWYSTINPPSTWLNLMQRNERLSNGAWRWNALSGTNASYSGTFANLSMAPSTGLFVTVGPTNTSFPGTLYDLSVDDSAAWGGYPAGVGSYALAADSTKIVAQAVVTSVTPAIGPMGVGASSGQSVINLIECDTVPTDLTSASVNLINSAGAGAGTATVNRDRDDLISCQAKASASSSSPTVPSTDSGFVAIGYATVPFGTSVVTSGMITNFASFAGFAQLNSSGVVPLTQGGTGLSSATTGCFGYNGSVYGHGNCVDAAGTGLSLSGTTLSLSTPVSVANGGTGNAGPSSNSFMCTNSGGTAFVQCSGSSLLSSVLSIGNGGTGSASPTGVSAGTGINVSGSFPSQTVSINGAVPQAFLNGSSLAGSPILEIVSCTISSGSCSVNITGHGGGFSGNSTAICATGNVGNSGAIATSYTISNNGGTINIFQSGGTGTVTAVCLGY